MPKEKLSGHSNIRPDSYIQSYLSQRELGSRFARRAPPASYPASYGAANPKNNNPKSPVKEIMSWLAPIPFSRALLRNQNSAQTLLNETQDSTNESNDYIETLMTSFGSEESVSVQEDQGGPGPFQSQKFDDDIMYFASRRLPSVLQEQEYDLTGMDKVFSAAWLSESQIVLGTKCQNLVVLDVNSGKKTIVPSMNPIQTDPTSLISTTQCNGIHSICINPSRTLLAVGAGKPKDNSKDFGIRVYSLPSFEPIATLYGHEDMVFSVSFIDEYTLVSGSRDKSVKTWKIFPLENDYKDTVAFAPIKRYNPIHSQTKHEQKVRDLVFDRKTTQLFTLSTDGSVKIWDAANATVTTSVPLEYTSETVCLALDPKEHFVSVGSQSHISIIDPRVGKVVHTFESLDDGWGVRSMTIHSSLLSIGGGLGRISFYDLRAQDYISWESPTDDQEEYLQSGSGWLCRDHLYQRNFQGMEVLNAVYSLTYDDTFGKLFIAGGPLQLNLKGSYAGLWK